MPVFDFKKISNVLIIFRLEIRRLLWSVKLLVNGLASFTSINHIIQQNTIIHRLIIKFLALSWTKMKNQQNYFRKKYAEVQRKLTTVQTVQTMNCDRYFCQKMISFYSKCVKKVGVNFTNWRCRVQDRRLVE